MDQESMEEKLNEVGSKLLEAKCLVKMGALASDSCIIDDELQLQDNLEYYVILRQINSILIDIGRILDV